MPAMRKGGRASMSHTVQPGEDVWIRACGGKWHLVPAGESVELQDCSWSVCRIVVRPIMQISTKRPEAGRCKRCETEEWQTR